MCHVFKKKHCKLALSFNVAPNYDSFQTLQQNKNAFSKDEIRINENYVYLLWYWQGACLHKLCFAGGFSKFLGENKKKVIVFISPKYEILKQTRGVF